MFGGWHILTIALIIEIDKDSKKKDGLVMY